MPNYQSEYSIFAVRYSVSGFVIRHSVFLYLAGMAERRDAECGGLPGLAGCGRAMERLKNACNRVVGTKQTQKAVEKGQVQVVYVARDAEERVVAPIVRLSEEKSLELVLVDTMAELGKACRIKVGAAAAAALRS